MWSRRSLLAGTGVFVLSFAATGTLRGAAANSADGSLTSIQIDERTVEVDDDGRPERLVRVGFVPNRRLVAIRLEGRVEDAATDLADTLDHDDDGWYVIVRRTGLGRRHRGETRYLRARRSQRVPDVDDRWLAKSRGFQPGSSAAVDFRGFRRGERLRLVAVVHDEEPTVVAEHVVGSAEAGADE
jgi:hypothetical protein